MPIGDSARTLQREFDRKARHIPSIAMVAISRCEKFVLHYDVAIVCAGRPLGQHRSGPRRVHSAKYRCRKTLPCLVVGLPSRSSPRLHPQGHKRSAFAKASARQSSLSSKTRAKTGGKGIRTPDFQLAKLALYQLSYAPRQLQIVDCKIADCKDRRSWTAATVFFFRTDLAEPEMPDHDLASRDPACTFCQSVLWLLAVKRYRQVRGPDTISIVSSVRNLA